MRYIFSLFTFVFVLILTHSALAQEAAAPPKTEKKLGWHPTANLGANFALSSVSNVVGQTDGSSETYGLNLNATYDFANERSEWQNKTSYAGSTTRTPVLPRFVKASDLLKYESVYLYSLPSYPKVGPYARFSAEAPLFMGEDVRPTAVTYNVTGPGGGVTPVTGNALRLTDGLKPLTTKESVGAFYKAYDGSEARVDVRLGLGAEQIMADGQLAVTGVDPAGTVNVITLRDVSQLGAEAAITGKGRIDERTAWEAGIETLTPFVSNKLASDDRGPLRLTNIDGVAKLSSNIFTWAALTYSYKVQIKPQLVDRTQQTHLMVVNFNYNLL